MLDEGNAWGMHAYEKSLYLDDLSDEIIDIFAQQLPLRQRPTLAGGPLRLGLIEPIAPANPYWAEHGVTFPDPDGFRVVLVPERWKP